MRPVLLALACLAVSAVGCAAPTRAMPDAPSVANGSAESRRGSRTASRRAATPGKPKAARRRARARAAKRARAARPRDPYTFPPPSRPASPGFLDGVPRARLTPAPLSSSRPDRLRSYVGRRDDQATDLQFALRASASVGAARSGLLFDDAEQLLEAAGKAEALTDDDPAIGDLVVFDKVGGKRGARTIGVVVDAVADGTVEFVFLWKGVVRRGWLNRARADEQRDPAGRTLNTFILGDRAWGRPGTRYLAGQLFSTYLIANRLRSDERQLVGTL